MAGHNKWSKVKHIKARVDAKKGKIFSKLAHEITVAAREGGGGDVALNARLRQAIDAAKAQSMPKDNIERAVKRGTGELGGNDIEEVYYEGYAPGGVAMLVHVATDNRNRSAADVRNLFNKNNGSMGTSGSVTYLFDLCGEIRLSAEDLDADGAVMAALEAGAEDVIHEEEEHLIRTPADQLNITANSLRDRDLRILSQSLVYVPQTEIEVAEPSIASQVLRLYEALDDYQDTLSVFSNFDIPDAVMETVMQPN